MFQDPIVINSSGLAGYFLPQASTLNMNKVPGGPPTGSVYRPIPGLDALISKSDLTISHQYGKRRRSLVRIDSKKDFEGENDVLAKTYPGGADLSVYMVVDVPVETPVGVIEDAISSLTTLFDVSNFETQFATGEA